MKYVAKNNKLKNRGTNIQKGKQKKQRIKEQKKKKENKKKTIKKTEGEQSGCMGGTVEISSGFKKSGDKKKMQEKTCRGQSSDRKAKKKVS